MDKYAELARNAELRGAVAAFVDSGLVKVASEEAFEALVDDVNTRLGAGDYDLQKVAAATDAAVAEYAAYKNGMNKLASYKAWRRYVPFVDETLADRAEYYGERLGGKRFGKQLGAVGRRGGELATQAGEGLARGGRYAKDLALRAARNPYVRGGALVAGGIGAGVGGRAVYDRYVEDDVYGA